MDGFPFLFLFPAQFGRQFVNVVVCLFLILSPFQTAVRLQCLALAMLTCRVSWIFFAQQLVIPMTTFLSATLSSVSHMQGGQAYEHH